jgi:hypothetical protein
LLFPTSLFVFPHSPSSAMDGTQGFAHGRQALCHWANLQPPSFLIILCLAPGSFSYHLFLRLIPT